MSKFTETDMNLCIKGEMKEISRFELTHNT